MGVLRGDAGIAGNCSGQKREKATGVSCPCGLGYTGFDYAAAKAALNAAFRSFAMGMAERTAVLCSRPSKNIMA